MDIECQIVEYTATVSLEKYIEDWWIGIGFDEEICRGTVMDPQGKLRPSRGRDEIIIPDFFLGDGREDYRLRI